VKPSFWLTSDRETHDPPFDARETPVVIAGLEKKRVPPAARTMKTLGPKAVRLDTVERSPKTKAPSANAGVTANEPRATLDAPCAARLDPAANEAGPLASTPAPNAELATPTEFSSHSAPKASPERNAALAWCHIIRRPGRSRNGARLIRVADGGEPPCGWSTNG
jgi:hypothetical protein